MRDGIWKLLHLPFYFILRFSLEYLEREKDMGLLANASVSLVIGIAFFCSLDRCPFDGSEPSEPPCA